MKPRWLEITTPQGSQFIRADQVVGVMPVATADGVGILNKCAALVQGMAGPLMLNLSPAKLVEELQRDGGPTLVLPLGGGK